MRLVSELNNMGVALLRNQEDLSKALQQFRKGLRRSMDNSMKANLTSARMIRHEVPKPCTVVNHKKGADPALRQSLTTRRSSRNYEHDSRIGYFLSSHEVSTFDSAVFAEGILVPESLAQLPTSYTRTYTGYLQQTSILCAILIFNLAVVHHTMASRSCNEEQYCMRKKAEVLYGQSYRLLQMYVPSRSEGSDTVDLLPIALYNNLAHLHMDLIDYQSAQFCSGLLMHYVSTLGAAACGETEAARTINENMHRFLFSAIIIRVPSTAPAA